MMLYGIQNDEDKWLLIMSPEGYFWTPTIPFRQLIEKEKNANQIATKLCKRKPEWKGRIKITPVTLNPEASIPFVFVEKEEEDE